MVSKFNLRTLFVNNLPFGSVVQSIHILFTVNLIYHETLLFQSVMAFLTPDVGVQVDLPIVNLLTKG